MHASLLASMQRESEPGQFGNPQPIQSDEKMLWGVVTI